MKTTQAAEEHVQQSNNLPEYSITPANRMKHLIASTQIVSPEIENNEKMINYSTSNIESDSDNTDENELLNINNVSSELICSNSRMTVDTAVLNFVNIYITNNKTKGCLVDDLQFLTSALPKPN